MRSQKSRQRYNFYAYLLKRTIEVNLNKFNKSKDTIYFEDYSRDIHIQRYVCRAFIIHSSNFKRLLQYYSCIERKIEKNIVIHF